MFAPGMKGVTCKSSAELELGNIVPGVFTPVLAKHSKSFSLIDCISVGVGRIQRNFEPMRKQVEVWQRSEVTDVTAKCGVCDLERNAALTNTSEVQANAYQCQFRPFRCSPDTRIHRALEDEVANSSSMIASRDRELANASHCSVKALTQ